VYLKVVFFKPLEHVLEKRRQETEGVRHLAEKAFASAEGKSSEFERALNAAKLELYREQEVRRQRLLHDQTATLAEARQHAQERIEEARRELFLEEEQATAELSTQVEDLAKQMIGSVVGRRAA
jgi:F0F1-type ATP synthase membrane subunit b/b'